MKEVVAELSQKELDEIVKQQEELAKYKELEKQGLLIKLPCAVGDTVWVIYDGYTTTAIVLAFYIDREGGMSDLKINTNEDSVTGGIISI